MTLFRANIFYPYTFLHVLSDFIINKIRSVMEMQQDVIKGWLEIY